MKSGWRIVLKEHIILGLYFVGASDRITIGEPEPASHHGTTSTLVSSICLSVGVLCSVVISGGYLSG